MATQPLLVLFLSTGNASRSLVAEALLNARQSGLYRARSAGISPAATVDPETVALLQYNGFDVAKLHPKKVQDFYAAASYVKVDVIITLSEEARSLCPVDWPGDPVRVHWDVDNPLGAVRPDQREWKLRKLYTTLEARIDMLMRYRPAGSPMETLLMLKDIGMVV
ncbi:MAG: hypothetical protein PHW63_00170 [Alphaproteobacteria bacterium]|nr:hypothetical protein [Alphaproteobacteria bacterium]